MVSSTDANATSKQKLVDAIDQSTLTARYPGLGSSIPIRNIKSAQVRKNTWVLVCQPCWFGTYPLLQSEATYLDVSHSVEPGCG